MSPTGPGPHCDRQQFLSPAHFGICHLTADLHDKNTSIFGTPRILVLSESTKGNVRERTFYFNNYYYKIIINLLTFIYYALAKGSKTWDCDYSVYPNLNGGSLFCY